MHGLAMNIVFMQTDTKLIIMMILTSMTIIVLYSISACLHTGKDRPFTQITQFEGKSPDDFIRTKLSPAVPT